MNPSITKTKFFHGSFKKAPFHPIIHVLKSRNNTLCFDELVDDDGPKSGHIRLMFSKSQAHPSIYLSTYLFIYLTMHCCKRNFSVQNTCGHQLHKRLMTDSVVLRSWRFQLPFFQEMFTRQLWHEPNKNHKVALKMLIFPTSSSCL